MICWIYIEGNNNHDFMGYYNPKWRQLLSIKKLNFSFKMDNTFFSNLTNTNNIALNSVSMALMEKYVSEDNEVELINLTKSYEDFLELRPNMVELLAKKTFVRLTIKVFKPHGLIFTANEFKLFYQYGSLSTTLFTIMDSDAQDAALKFVLEQVNLISDKNRFLYRLYQNVNIPNMKMILDNYQKINTDKGIETFNYTEKSYDVWDFGLRRVSDVKTLIKIWAELLFRGNIGGYHALLDTLVETNFSVEEEIEIIGLAIEYKKPEIIKILDKHCFYVHYFKVPKPRAVQNSFTSPEDSEQIEMCRAIDVEYNCTYALFNALTKSEKLYTPVNVPVFKAAYIRLRTRLNNLSNMSQRYINQSEIDQLYIDAGVSEYKILRLKLLKIEETYLDLVRKSNPKAEEEMKLWKK